ncbi:DUF998 domain-containing protein [Georgenia alba]|uniref:DUF998 domain-containing protein n=1 Tax=Georgenia alba TaxID=2233858 RepID=A0ABW2Q7Y0_9MICO
MTALLWLGAAGLMLFVLTFLIDGATRPGYRPVRHPVSALALGGRGWVQAVNFVLCGALVTAGAVGLLATSAGWLAAPVGCLGLGLVASGLFPMDPVRGYPPGTPEGDPEVLSRTHQLHDAAGAVVFLAMPVSAFVGALVLDGAAWRIGSAAVGVLLLVLNHLFTRAWTEDWPRTGLVQRATIITAWAWLAWTFVHLAGGHAVSLPGLDG